LFAVLDASQAEPKNPKIQREIDELLQMGFIEHSKSPCSSPIVMVKKKTGKWRLCVDFRQINFREVFRRLREANLRLNPEKCQFFKKELLYLGHRVTSEGIGTDPEKVAAIAELEPPSIFKELRQYLGVASWHRRFFQNRLTPE